MEAPRMKLTPTIIKNGQYNQLVRHQQGDEVTYLVEDTKVATSLEQAWEKTLEKWEMALYAHRKFGKLDSDGGADTCGLCNAYLKSGCEGCPVKEYTGAELCNFTPYMRYHAKPSVETAYEEYKFLLTVKLGGKPCLPYKMNAQAQWYRLIRWSKRFMRLWPFGGIRLS